MAKDVVSAPISYPEDYGGAPRLNLVCTQLDLSAYEQRKLVESWTEILPTLGDVRFLWLSSRAIQSRFEAACASKTSPFLQMIG